MRLVVKVLSNKWVLSYLIIMASVAVASAAGSASQPVAVTKTVGGQQVICIQFSATVMSTSRSYVKNHPNPAGPGVGTPPANPINFCDDETGVCWDYWVTPVPDGALSSIPGSPTVHVKRWAWEVCLPPNQLTSGDTMSMTFTFTAEDGTSQTVTMTYTHP